VDSASILTGSTLLVVQGGTGYPINAGAAKNVKVAHCRMNNYSKGAEYQDGMGANVTNLIVAGGSGTGPANVVHDSVTL